ncbi:MAG TPA: helix-turn-helix transcriptional regulator [Sphingomicrobium sp.]|nr:helix-turn-helix transcriptional regulator [Sphingomicrobium sp.]
MGQRIQRLLDQRCLSQSELARRVNLRQSTINALIHGKSRSSTHLHRIARELGTTAAYLTGETDDPGPNAAGEDERLSSQERRLIAIYRQLPKADRAALKRMVERMADEGKGSDDGHGT